MGASTSTISTEPKALKEGIKIIDDALDKQYNMLVKLTDECNNLKAEQQKKVIESQNLLKQYKQCRSALEVLSKRDAELRRSVSKSNARYTGQYQGTEGNASVDPYKSRRGANQPRNDEGNGGRYEQNRYEGGMP